MAFRYDESNPQLLIVYTGGTHRVDDYREFMRRWSARFDRQEHVGIIMVNEPYLPTNDTPEQREKEGEERVKLLNDFRRLYRDLSNQYTLGYVNVYPADAQWLLNYLDKDDGLTTLQANADRRAQYMYGTRGYLETDLESAKQWILDQASLAPIEIDMNSSDALSSMSRIGLFYGSTSGVTEKIAYEIQDAWQATGMGDLPPVNIGYVKNLSALLDYDYLILGVPTWNIGQLQDDWEIAFPQFDGLDFTGKQIALFGIGDQYNYADNFLDALGILAHKLRQQGATLIGYTASDSYEFAESLAIEGDQFMGLGIDERHQANLTANRIESWIRQLIQEFNLQPVS